MLPHEITPYANAHIDAIEKMRDEMLQLMNDQTSGVVEIPLETLSVWRHQLATSTRGFYRFQVCMADEVRMKEQLHEKNLTCRLNHQQ